MRTLTRRMAIGWFFIVPSLAWAEDLTLVQVLGIALEASQRGELLRSRYAVQRAVGAVKQAEGAFDWSTGGSAGVVQVYQHGSSNGFLTTEVERHSVPTSTVFAERQLASGVRVRPGFTYSQSPGDFKPELARLQSSPFLQVDIPVDGTYGQPADDLRLGSARSALAAAEAESQAARANYLHGVVSAVWAYVGARERSEIDTAHAARAESISARMKRLAGAGEVAAVSAEELGARAELARIALERSELDMLTRRLELAALLGLEPERVTGVTAELPEPPAQVPDRAQLDRWASEAVEARPDVQSQRGRLEQARLQARLTQRDAESKVTLTLSNERVMLNWQMPLGEARQAGAIQETAAQIGTAQSGLDEARRRARTETRIAYERLLAGVRAIDLARASSRRMQERAALVERLVQAGRQPPASALDAEEQLAGARRQELDARLVYAQALADLRRATAALPADSQDPSAIARIFVTTP